jgi:predicted NAD-dependent protein-ADP-ribosyltransferase YbiA (DUF1768 family)
MKSLSLIILFILLLFTSEFVNAQRRGKLQGAWQLVSQKIDGKNHPVAGRQIKLVTANHFTWIQQDKKQLEELLKKGTPHDSAVAYHDMAGAGTYKISGNTYTETTEFFYDPQNIGTSIDWKFKLKGNLWYTSGHYVHYKDGKKIEDILLEQVWKRIE